MRSSSRLRERRSTGRGATSSFHWLSGADYPYADHYNIPENDFTHFLGPGYFMIDGSHVEMIGT